MKKYSIKSYLSVALAGCVLAAMTLPNDVYAGFEWVPSSKQTSEPDIRSADILSPAPHAQNTQRRRNITPSQQAPDNNLLILPPPPSSAGLRTIDIQPTSEKPTILPLQNTRLKTKVIVPDDAPPSATLDETRNTQRLNQPIDQIKPRQNSNAIIQEPITKAPPPRQTTKAAPPTSTDINPVVGFGSDMPLAIALRQVVPSHFSFSFGQSVNPGARVSWSGGKTWEETVSDMVQPLGLSAVIRGKVVHIKEPRVQPRAAIQNLPETPLIIEEVEPVTVATSLLESPPLRADIPAFNKAASKEIIVASTLSKTDGAAAPVSSSLPRRPLSNARTPIFVKPVKIEPKFVPSNPVPLEPKRISAPDSAEIIPQVTKQPDLTNSKITPLKDLTDNSKTKTAEELNQGVLNANANGRLVINPHPTLNALSDTSASLPPPAPLPIVAKAKKQNIAPPPRSFISAIKEQLAPSRTRPFAEEGNEDVASSVQYTAPKRERASRRTTKNTSAISASKVRFWEAEQGSSLRQTLTEWSAKADTDLVWNASSDYTIKSNLLVNDTFQNAVKTMFSKVLSDPNGPALELISEGGENASSKLIIDDLG